MPINLCTSVQLCVEHFAGSYCVFWFVNKGPCHLSSGRIRGKEKTFAWTWTSRTCWCAKFFIWQSSTCFPRAEKTWRCCRRLNPRACQVCRCCFYSHGKHVSCRWFSSWRTCPKDTKSGWWNAAEALESGHQHRPFTVWAWRWSCGLCI